MRKKTLLLLALIVSFASVLSYSFLTENRLESNPYNGNLVIGVIDGDTFVIEGKQRVRFLELDSPSLENCGGEESRKFLEDLILGKKVILDEILTDSFGRIMALVYLDGVLVNEEILKNGWGVANGPKTSQGEKLRLTTSKAKEDRVGIFSSECRPLNPPSSNCLIKGNINPKENTKIYNFPGCSAYDQVIVEKYMGDDWFCSEKEAEKAGFIKSKTCYGKSYEVK